MYRDEYVANFIVRPHILAYIAFICKIVSIFFVQLILCSNVRKEAQKCYCEAPNCRGWIGETPEEEKEKIEKKEKREKDTKKKKEEKKPADYMEDEDVRISLLIL